MRVALLAITLLLSACGFHLRGHNLKEAAFAFHSIYVRAPADTPFVSALKSRLELYKLQLAPSADKADLTLQIVSESADKQILALSGGGHVREYQLHYRVSFRAYDQQQQDWLPAGEIDLQRDFNYDDSQILAKAQEEGMIYQDMRSDAVQQIIFRLSLAKPPPDSAQ
ncbi:MAG: hypothetical protein GC139_07785 [Sideroxydans sp.]|nr:hypothetical protein [Sideroxydans sp.]